MAFCCCLQLIAQGTSYYRKVEGLKGVALKKALHDLIQPDQVLNYGGKGEGYTWEGFFLSDQMEGGYVRDRYSNELRQFNNDLTAVSNMNIEHIWANSWWGHVVNNAYCDLFNLFPSDADANRRKSNNPIGVVDGTVSWDNDVIKVGKSSSYGAGKQITAWEPADEWKGDFARVYFYMATCYQHMRDLWCTAEGLLTVNPESDLLLQPWVSQLMLDWANEDPVDEIEEERNRTVHGIQGNRNPFIDYPTLSSYIWGDSTSHVFYIDKESELAELFVPEAETELNFGLQPLSKGFETNLTIRGRNFKEGVQIHMDNPEFELGATSATKEQLTDGFALPLRISPREPGSYNTILTILGSGYEQTNLLTIDFVDGIPAYEATDIVCSVHSRRFTANWMNYEPGAEYTLEVYTKDENGTHVDFATYTTPDTTYQVKNVKSSTTYYYTVSIIREGELIAGSNEIRVEMPETTPVFSVTPMEINFTTVPGKDSESKLVNVTALAVQEYVTYASVEEPFQISIDGEEWVENLILAGNAPTFFVRMAAQEAEGEYEGEMVLTTAGVEEKIVTLTACVDAQKSFFEDFENATKGAYATASVACNANTWTMNNALLAADDNRNGGKSVRMKGAGCLEMESDKTSGCDSLWFWTGLYNKDKGVRLRVSYSLDGGETWTPVGQDIIVGTWQRYGFEVKMEGNIRLRFENLATGNKRINIDDIQMSDYKRSTHIVDVLAEEDPDRVVRVYTPGGVLVRKARRSEALKGLRHGTYILK